MIIPNLLGSICSGKLGSVYSEEVGSVSGEEVGSVLSEFPHLITFYYFVCLINIDLWGGGTESI